MDSEKPHTCKFIPEIGRGCAFADGGNEAEARPCDGCFKLHETPWLEGYPENIPTDIFEVRFKNTRRSFYQNVNNLPLKRGDIVAVEASPGHDIGIVSLTGDLVAKQMRRTGFNPYNGEYRKIYRKAKPYDIERWQEAIALEHETMIAARQIAADMALNMKIGDVEYQGDKIKAIFYYIADERVDFRELIKVFAERFHIRIEMKQIGARQEAGRIGGLGACGRELCCASWMSSFSSVTTGAARVQDISLNPQKLAGQCSKLKCCLMYEYDAYADARKEFPRLREPLQTAEGEWFFVKNDLLAGTMYFSSSKETMSNLAAVRVERVKEIIRNRVRVGCTGCGYCMPCPKGVDIPGAFRCYNAMYTEGRASGRKEYLQCTAMRQNPSSASQCVRCGKCESHCPQGIPIRQELQNAAKALETIPYKAAKGAIRFFKLW